MNRSTRFGIASALLVLYVLVLPVDSARAESGDEISATLEGRSCTAAGSWPNAPTAPLPASGDLAVSVRCFYNPLTSGRDSALATIWAYPLTGTLTNAQLQSPSAGNINCASGSSYTIVDRGQMRNSSGTVSGVATRSGLPYNYMEVGFVCKGSVAIGSSGHKWVMYPGDDTAANWSVAYFRGWVPQQIGTSQTSYTFSCCGFTIYAPYVDYKSSDPVWSSATTEPDHFGPGGGFLHSNCEDVTMQVALRRGGESSFTSLTNPSGTTALNHDTVRLTFDHPTDEPTTFWFRWNATQSFRLLGIGNSGLYPVPFEVTKTAADGAPSDLGSAEVKCRDENGVDNYRELASTSDWEGASSFPGGRPCANMTWTWPDEDEIAGDFETAYTVAFTFDKNNGGEHEVIGLYLDLDDPAEDYPKGRLSHFDASDPDSYEWAVDVVYDGEVTTGAELHDFGDGGYDPPDGEYTNGFFSFIIGHGEDTSLVWEAAQFGVWCDDDDGPPILYRFDSTYETTPLTDDGEPGRSAGACYSTVVSGMSLTAPVTWVTGLGKLAVCLVEWLFVPDSAYVSEEWDELYTELQQAVPFSWVFTAYDTVSEAASGLESGIEAHDTDCVRWFPTSFNSTFDVPEEDTRICPSELASGGGAWSAWSVYRVLAGVAVWIWWLFEVYRILFPKASSEPEQLTLF